MRLAAARWKAATYRRLPLRSPTDRRSGGPCADSWPWAIILRIMPDNSPEAPRHPASRGFDVVVIEAGCPKRRQTTQLPQYDTENRRNKS